MKPRFDTDLTALQKAVSIARFKEVKPVLEGETNAQYLERIAQEHLYTWAVNLNRAKKLQEANTSVIS